MRKPLIGIVPLIDTEKNSYWMLPGYMDAVKRAGGIGIMLPPTQLYEDLHQLAQSCDGLLFTGGHDISPTLYGVQSTELCGEILPDRDAMEAGLLKEALALDKPILGICRGMQLINAVLGGTLIQDIPKQFPSEISHRQPAPYNAPSHSVSVTGALAACLETDTIMVNSCHHQGIEKLSPALESMAAAPDGLIEAVCMPGKRFLWAFQWHPEMLQDENSNKIFQSFLDAAK